MCEDKLPHEPRPVFRVGKSARLLIVGQAPGRRVHETGIPWNDPSGDVLRAWLGTRPRRVLRHLAHRHRARSGLCYPGTVDGADLPPCARMRAALAAALPRRAARRFG